MDKNKVFKMQNLKNRIACEKSITKTLIKSILDLGYLVAVYDGEQKYNDLTAKQALDNAMAVDECWIYARKHSEQTEGKFKTYATFYLIYGNDGFDVICDHSVNEYTDQILLTVNPVVEKWENKILGL
jgi:hypothetical protein